MVVDAPEERTPGGLKYFFFYLITFLDRIKLINPIQTSDISRGHVIVIFVGLLCTRRRMNVKHIIYNVTFMNLCS